MKFQNEKVSVFHVGDWDCSGKLLPQNLVLEFAGEHQIFFLESEMSILSNAYTLQPTQCGSSVWEPSLQGVIKDCFQSTSCSLDWFEEKEFPVGYTNVFYK